MLFRSDDIGDARDVLREPAKLEFPNLRITLAESSAKTWTDWFEDFVIKGNNDDSKEKSGAIVFLSPNRQSELGRITLHNLGIFALRERPAQANDQVARLVAELYCERMEFQVGAKPAVLQPAAPILHPRVPIGPEVPRPRAS